MAMPLVDRVCENTACGRAFTARATEVAHGRGRFCSRSCLSSSNARRKHALHPQLGAANPGFKNWSSRNKRAYVDRFRAKNPEKARAHDAVRDALRAGRLVRPAACQSCAVIGPTQAHHPDYSKPLIVIFACRECHRKLDRARRLQEVA